jgi:hypothetical protein
MDDIHGKEIKLFRTTVKIPGQMRPRGSESSNSGGLPSSVSRLSNGPSKTLDSSKCPMFFS